MFIKDYYINREYSWLMFNKRVLDQANDLTNPLLERCKFLAITCSNLDEFYMVRVGSLYDESLVSPNQRENKTGLTASEQIQGILKETKTIYKEIGATYVRLKRALAKNGVRILKGNELTERQRLKCADYFIARVLPLLSPMVLDAKHPMIHFDNNHTYLMTRLERGGREMFGVVSISTKLERLYRIGGGKRINLITVEELVNTFGGMCFNGYEVKSCSLVRVTRNADFDASVDDTDVEHDFDFSKFLRRKVEMRSVSAPVRVEVDKDSDDIRAFLLKALNVKKQFCFKIEHYFDYKFLFSLSRFIEPQALASLRYSPFKGRIPTALENTPSLIDKVLSRDVFLAYPFDSMQPLVQLLDECATDKRVVSIKITIYRLDDHSRIVEALKKASECGKEVTVVIELCARFDEENNLHYASVLADAGCTIIYGMENYKVHSKIISVVLSDNGSLKYITHLGTGNYNEGTSRQYTDLNIITANREIGEDAVAFFRNIAICNTKYDYKKLLIAPVSLKTGIISYIERETEKAKSGKPASIIAKMNSLTDKPIIEKLVEASKAGVRIKLIVRGICCLLPEVEGKTENISVISIVGRFLEHSRIYCFGSGSDRAMFISSADLMTRNTEKRVEIATPVLDKSIADRIYTMLEIILADNIKARRLNSKGEYFKADPIGAALDSQDYFLKNPV